MFVVAFVPHQCYICLACYVFYYVNALITLINYLLTYLLYNAISMAQYYRLRGLNTHIVLFRNSYTDFGTKLRTSDSRYRVYIRENVPPNMLVQL